MTCQFWEHNAPERDALSSSLASTQPFDQAQSFVPKRAQRNRSAVDGSHLFLDFLYPQGARDFAALSLSRPSRRLSLRRRRRWLPGYSRAYTTEATNLQKILLDDSNAPEPQYEETDIHIKATENLARFLEQGEKDFDKAWVLYIAAGQPARLRPAFSIYLSQSLQKIHLERAWQIFQQIPSQQRSTRLFVKITMGQIHHRSKRPFRLKSICEDAVSRGLGDIPCAMSLAHHAGRHDWVNALEIWNLASLSTAAPELTRPSPEQLIYRIRRNHLPRVVLSLGHFMSDHPNHAGAHDLARTLLARISQSYHLLATHPMDILIRAFQKFHELGILEVSHYITIIETLQSSTTRPIFLRTVFYYRLMRQNLPEAKPPAKLLNGQISGLGSFGITHGVQFFLSELTHFWGKPSIEAYKQALINCSRSGDVVQVQHVFDALVADHGNPRSRRLLTPLLNVHARAGNLAETHAQFERISEEFHLKPNTVCWNILLKAHATTKDDAGALSLFSQMIQDGISPDSYTFGTLMGIAAGRGDIESIRWLLKEAQRCQVKITMPMLDTIAQVYCQDRRPDLAEKLAEATQSMNIQGSPIRMWNMILVYYAFRMDRDRWMSARRYMRRNGIRGDSMTIAARLLMLALRNRAHRARRLLRAFHKLRVIQSTELHHSIVLLGFIRVRNRRMIRIVLNEMLRRFGQDMSATNLSKYMSRIDHDLKILETGDPSDRGDANQRLEDTEQSLIQSLSFSNTSLPRSFPFLKTAEETPDVPLTTSQYEYLVSHYGRRGTIKQATEMFHKYLASKNNAGPSENELDSVPFKILSIMMRAHLSADEFDKVEELWRMALSNAIKLGQPLRIDQFLAPRSLDFSSGAPSTSSPETPQETEIDRAGSLNDSDPEFHRQPQILPSKRFILSELFSTYLRSLAYRNGNGKIPRAVNELESAGFEVSGTNWCTYVQMMAASDHIADVIEAFQVFEHKFMPQFPGWSPLLRGYALKPDGDTTQTHLLELPFVGWGELRRHKRKPFFGRQARKDFRKLQPESMMPTYLTTVYLAAALNRIREVSITEGTTTAKDIDQAAPKTIQMISQMPYRRDRFQGTLLRSHESRPDVVLSTHDERIAPGGVLGRGVVAQLPRRRRPPVLDEVEQDEETLDDDQSTECQLPTESQRTIEGDQKLELRRTVEDQMPTENQPSTEDQQQMEGQSSIEIERLHSQIQHEKGEHPIVDRQPTGDRLDPEIAQSTKGEPTPEREGVKDRNQPHVYQAPKNAPHAYRAQDNETARLLADLFGPEDADGKRQSLLPPEDRIDIRNDIFYLRNMRRLKFEKHLAKLKKRGLLKEKTAARKARKSKPSPSFEDGAEEAHDAEDDLEDKLEIQELQELDRNHSLKPEAQSEPDKSSSEGSVDHERLDELDGLESDNSKFEGSTKSQEPELQDSAELNDDIELDDPHSEDLVEVEQSDEALDSDKEGER